MKYIIDIPNNPMFVTACYLNDGIPKAFNLELEPYTEPDRKAIEDEVWEFAAICTKMNGADLVDIFGGFLLDSFTKYSYQEAKAKYEAWKKQEDEVRVGDEVLPMDTQYDTMIVTRTWKDDYWKECIDTVGFDGSICSFLQSEVKKTGRHFDEIEELLKKMRRNQNEN